MRISDWSSDVCSSDLPGTSLKHFLASYPGRVLIAADSAGRREALIETLATAGLKPQNVESWQSFLSRHSGESRNPVSLARPESLDPSFRWDDEQNLQIGRASCRERGCR